ncbi:MAG: hypothetical protein HYZ90_07060, partial [Candidatus Omnitrophica bacterium]|nr:hypothetical protein [Candidatus Omnitrophota bacterium]
AAQVSVYTLEDAARQLESRFKEPNTLGVWLVAGGKKPWVSKDQIRNQAEIKTKLSAMAEGPDADKRYTLISHESPQKGRGIAATLVTVGPATGATAGGLEEGIRHAVVLTFDSALQTQAQRAMDAWKAGRSIQVTYTSSLMDAGRPIREPSASVPPVDAVVIIAGDGANPNQLEGFLEAVVRNRAIQTVLISSPKLSGQILPRINSLVETRSLRNVEADLTPETLSEELPLALDEVDAVLRRLPAAAGLEEKEVMEDTRIIAPQARRFQGLFEDGDPGRLAKDPEILLHLKAGQEVWMVRVPASPSELTQGRLFVTPNTAIPRTLRALVSGEVLKKIPLASRLEGVGGARETLEEEQPFQTSDLALVSASLVRANEARYAWDRLLSSFGLAGITITRKAAGVIGRFNDRQLAAFLDRLQEVQGLITIQEVAIDTVNGEEQLFISV